MTNARIMELLNNNSRTGISEVLNYLRKISITGLNINENGLNEILERVNEIDEQQRKYLMDVDLFKLFTSNRNRITPTLSSTWKIDYRNTDVYSGYMVLENDEGIRIQRVPSSNFFKTMKKGLLNENGEPEELKIIGGNLEGRFIVNHHRQLFSEGFYNLWRKIHFPETEEEDNNEVNKDNIEVGKYYLANKDLNGIYLEKFLGAKYIVKYKIIAGELVPHISKQKLALQIYLGNYTLSHNMNVNTCGKIKILSPYKKLKYYEEFNNLPFLRSMSEEEERKKISSHYNYQDNIIDILDELPASKKEIGFKLVPSDYDDIINVIKIQGKYVLINNIRVPRGNTHIQRCRPKGIIRPDINTIGKIHIDREQVGNNFDREEFLIANDLSDAYKIQVTPFINNGIQLNIIDDIIG